jgi:hypothetical protein
MSEDFMIHITPAEARAHATGGVVGIQLRGTSSHTALLSIPLSYFEAVASLAGDPGERAAISAPAAPKAPALAKPAAKKPSQPAHKKSAITCITCS